MKKGHFKLVTRGILFFILLLPVALFIIKTGKPVEASPDSAVFFTPATLTVSHDQAFSVDAMINPGANQITAVELHISFDATKLNLNSITNNSAFPQVLQAAQINNTNGTASIILGTALADPPSPVITQTAMATLAFEVIGTEGTSSVSFANGTQAAAINEIADVITNKTASEISIGREYGNSDFATLVADWLQTKSSVADIDGNGTVNSKDLGIMMCNWEN